MSTTPSSRPAASDARSTRRSSPGVTGVPLREFATVHGRTELDIIDETLRLHAVPADPDTVQQMTAALAEQDQTRFDELRRRVRVLSGVEAALSLLDHHPDVTQTVLTATPEQWR